jgi:uncharacterized alpha-E superfamily protein
MRHAAMVRGAIDATLLRNDGFNFLNIGYYLERGDNTARLMDVKYYVLLPRVDFVGSGLDNYQWTTLLRAMGAHRAFHWAYGGEVTAAKIADFLILNPQSPAVADHLCRGVEQPPGPSGQGLWPRDRRRIGPRAAGRARGVDGRGDL